MAQLAGHLTYRWSVHLGIGGGRASEVGTT
jgi:hypothetical protein